MRRRTERGFTLLELVLALSIVAVMLTILFGGLRMGLRAWQRAEEHAEALDHARSIAQVIEQTLSGTYPFQAPIDKLTPAQMLFQGEADKVSLVTMSPPLPLPVAFTAVTFSMEGGAVFGLAIREKALPNFDPFEAVRPSVVDPTVTGIRFGYLRDDGGSWEDTWDGAQEKAVPRAVKVTLTTMINGRVQEQPSITVPVRVTTP